MKRAYSRMIGLWRWDDIVTVKYVIDEVWGKTKVKRFPRVLKVGAPVA